MLKRLHGRRGILSGTATAFEMIRRNAMSNAPQVKTAATTTNTVRLHRVLTAKPEKVYRAFLDADAMAKWLPPRGFTAKVYHMDAKVAARSRCRSQTSRPAKPIPSVENTSSSCHTSASVTRIGSTTRTFRMSCT
jgi:hypothetical protein